MHFSDSLAVPFVALKPNTNVTHELLLQFQAGDEQALEELWARYLPRLKRWAHGRLPASQTDAGTDDLVQDAFVRSLSRLRTFRPRSSQSLFAFFKQIVLNQIRDYVRKTTRRPTRELLKTDEHFHSGPSPLQQLLGREVFDAYERALSQLSAEDGELIFAAVELGCTDAELAELFEKSSVDAARMARGRALGRLARALKRIDASIPPAPASSR